MEYWEEAIRITGKMPVPRGLCTLAATREYEIVKDPLRWVTIQRCRRARGGDYVFENEWQSFRTKRDRSLELKNVFHTCEPGRRKIVVKVMDIFGNDTMTILYVSVGKEKS